MENDPFVQKRQAMVKEQLEKRGIKDRALLTVMREIPRHIFLPDSMTDIAYIDQAISLGEGKSISQPYVVAHMIEKLQLKNTDRILDIGTGTGYQTAILAELVKHVYTIEIDKELHEKSKQTLGELGYENVSFRLADGLFGWKEEEPFDAIILSAASEIVPRDLLNQLGKDGRMILPLGHDEQSLVLIRKNNNQVTTEELGAVQFVRLQNVKSDDLQ
jgi:protein-L-isoaspartate(D-aspartate) O-methyltransferase